MASRWCKSLLPRLLLTWIPIPSNPCAVNCQLSANTDASSAGIVELTTDKNSFSAGMGDFVASGGSFDQTGWLRCDFLVTRKRASTPCARSACIPPGYLDPPVTSNFGNDGNSGGFSAD